MGNCKSKNSKQKIKLNHEKYNNQENRMIENISQNEKEINLNHEKYNNQENRMIENVSQNEKEVNYVEEIEILSLLKNIENEVNFIM